MKISVIKVKNYYMADCLDLSGTPPCGIGNTEVEAVVHLFYRLIFESTTGGLIVRHRGLSWISSVKNDDCIFINDIKWQWPKDIKL